MSFWSAAAPFIAPVVQTFGNLLGQQSDEEASTDARRANEYQMNVDRVLQREFAQNGIRWKVADAKAAGLHPLAALGSQGANYAPVSSPQEGPPSKGNVYRSLGQDISRAISSTATAEEREMNKLNLASARADLDGKVIDNQIRAAQLQKLQAPGSGPPGPGSTFSVPGQSSSKLIQEKPLTRTTSVRGHDEPGAITSLGYGVNSDGSLTPVPSSDFKERIEDNLFHEASHFFRNNIVPNFTGGNPPPGYHWDYFSQGYKKNKYKNISDWDRKHKNYGR